MSGRQNRDGRGHARGDALVNIENLAGSPHNDDLTGDHRNNVLQGGLGDDRLDGGAGSDIALYLLPVTVTANGDGSLTVEGVEGTDTLTGIESVMSAAMAVNGATLTLTLRQDLDSTPEPSDFRVMVNRRARAVTGVAVDGKTVTLTLDRAVASGASVEVRYPSRQLEFLNGPAVRRFGLIDLNVAQLLPPPGNLGVSTDNSLGITVTWDATANASEMGITGYVVKWRGSSGAPKEQEFESPDLRS